MIGVMAKNNGIPLVSKVGLKLFLLAKFDVKLNFLVQVVPDNLLCFLIHKYVYYRNLNEHKNSN